jgi:ribosomal protein S18 acetylase RimI-like enzyme
MIKEGEVVIRAAEQRDVQTIVKLLADDPLGARREVTPDASFEAYVLAFHEIANDPNNLLMVADISGAVVGVLQLTLMPSLTYQGAWRAQIEGVRVSSDHRSMGIGAHLIQWAAGHARERGCRLLQLTTDKKRPDALEFYERQGFESSHYGLKFDLLAKGATSA